MRGKNGGRESATERESDGVRLEQDNKKDGVGGEEIGTVPMSVFSWRLPVLSARESCRLWGQSRGVSLPQSIRH